MSATLMPSDVAISAVKSDSSLQSIRLSELRGKKVLIVGFPHDFDEESKDCLVRVSQQSHLLDHLGCVLLFASAYSVNGHLNWLGSWAGAETAEAAAAAAAALAAPLLGDTAGHLARRFGVLDPSSAVYLPSMVFLNEEGELCNRIIEDHVNDLDLNKAVPILQNLQKVVKEEMLEEEMIEEEEKEDVLEKEVRLIRPGSFSSEMFRVRQLLMWGDADVTAIIFFGTAFNNEVTKQVDLLSAAKDNFDNRRCKLVFCSTDSVQSQLAWLRSDVDETALDVSTLKSMPYAMISDPTGELAAAFKMLDKEANVAVDGVLLLDSRTGKPIVKMSSRNGPNLHPDEILRLLPTAERKDDDNIVVETNEDDGHVAHDNAIPNENDDGRVEELKNDNHEEIAPEATDDSSRIDEGDKAEADESDNINHVNSDVADTDVSDTAKTDNDPKAELDVAHQEEQEMSNRAQTDSSNDNEDEMDKPLPPRTFQPELSIVVEEERTNESASATPVQEIKKMEDDDDKYYVDNTNQVDNRAVEVLVASSTREDVEGKDKDHEDKNENRENKIEVETSINSNAVGNEGSSTERAKEANNDSNMREEGNKGGNLGNETVANLNGTRSEIHGAKVDARFDPSVSVNYGRVIRPNAAIASPKEKSCCALM